MSCLNFKAFLVDTECIGRFNLFSIIVTTLSSGWTGSVVKLSGFESSYFNLNNIIRITSQVEIFKFLKSIVFLSFEGFGNL